MKIKFLITLLLISIGVSSQVIAKKRTTKTTLEIDKNTILIEKETGKKISYDQFREIKKSHPNVSIFVKDEDINGKPLSYYIIINPNDDKGVYSNSEKVNIKRKDIFNKIFNLDSIDNKKTLIILQMELQMPRVNVKHLKEAEEAAIGRGYASVILTYSNAKISKEFVYNYGLKSVIIPNAQGLIRKFGSKRFPMYYILDEDKKIESSVEYFDEVALKLVD